MSMRTVGLGVVALMVAVVATPAPGAQSEGGRDVGVQSTQSMTFYPKVAGGGRAEENPVTVSFNGRTYEGGWWLSRIEESALTEAESFLANAIEANRDLSPDEVLELWNPPERDEVRSMVSDPEMFAANRRFYRGIEDSALVAKILYGPYILFYVQHVGAFNDFIKEYPVVETGSGYYLTNALQADPVFQYFSTAYVESLELVEPPEREGADGP